MAGNIAARQLTRDSSGDQPYTARGPAFTIQYYPEHAPNDSVNGFWCPQWPNEARNWPKRQRDNGWPTVDTISEVVQHGCHVVYVQHRDCRSDELQWRYSFSIAEVILIQSWTKTQQIVYNLLRFFCQKELLDKDCPKEDEVICNYHLKTLMLWTCEETSSEMWNSASVIVICCDLLLKLSEWLRRKFFPNYFIPDANLFHESSSSTMLDRFQRQLKKFCKLDDICQWFVANCIRSNIPTHFQVEQIMHSKFSLLPTEDWKTLHPESLDLMFSDEFVFCNIYSRKTINSQSIQPRSILSQMRALRKFRMLGDRRMSTLPMPVDISCFTCLDKTISCLNTAYSLEYGEISCDGELFEYVRGIFLKTQVVRCKWHVFPEPLTAEKSRCQFLRAQQLMQNLTGSNCPSELQLISLLSGEFLISTLLCEDSESKSIAPAALVYLAALHYATSESQIVINLCSAVLLDQTINTENETLNAGCLFFIDDVVRILGFYLLCRRFTKIAPLQQMRNQKCASRGLNYFDLRLSVKVFAYFLIVDSAGRISEQFSLHLDLPTSLSPLDKLFVAFTKRKRCIQMKSGTCLKSTMQFEHPRIDHVTAIFATSRVDRLIFREKVIDNLTESAIENIASFYSVIPRVFGIHCNTEDCYRALHLYKGRKYSEVAQLCEQILREPDLQNDLKKFGFANVLVKQPFSMFFDKDVQSLVGFHTLLYFLSPNNDDFQKFKFAANYFDHCVPIFPLSKHYTVKSSHFLGRHFLARYLKLRCYLHMESKQQFRNALVEFAAAKINLPFEYIIRRFLLRRHSGML